MRIGFYLFLVIEKLISLLPYKLLYILSDFLYFILYILIGYRKEVVFNNLKNSFPEKTKEELIEIRKRFFHSLTDILVETVKIAHTNERQLSKRISYKNQDIINNLIKEGRSVFAIAGHTANWEFGGIFFPYVFKVKTFAIYQEQSNPYFDAYIKKYRSHFGIIPITTQQSFRKFIENKNELTFNIVVGDQAPPTNGEHYWTTFLNQETAFYTGTEKMSKYFDYAVIFASVKRIKRGYYEVEFKLITENPKETEEFEITEKYVRYLEQYINENPDSWLWSHRRWKRKRIIK